MKWHGIIGSVVACACLPGTLACGSDGDGCYGPTDKVEHVRHVKRIQPGAPEAVYGPKAPLEWGQVNFMHTVRAGISIGSVGGSAV